MSIKRATEDKYGETVPCMKECGSTIWRMDKGHSFTQVGMSIKENG